MCDCVAATRRILCRDCGADCIDCWEWTRSLVITFCQGFTDEACRDLCTHVRRRCTCGQCQCTDGRGAGAALAHGVASMLQTTVAAGRACFCVFGFVRDVPCFVLGLVMMAAVVAAALWYSTATSFALPLPLSAAIPSDELAARLNSTVTRLRGWG